MTKRTGSRRPGAAERPVRAGRSSPSPLLAAANDASHVAEGTVPATDLAAPESANAGAPPIVGVGASSGGLEAFTELLRHMPLDTGFAFVLIQHLDPNHESHLAELLSKASLMPVTEVADGTRAMANHVYVIPPQANLGISDGVLYTPARPSQRQGQNLPIDAFLNALAADRGNQAFGVVLSGAASDGTAGLQAIQAAGGITFAQDAASAKFAAMPGNAVAAGVVDFVLPPAGIARRLASIARRARFIAPAPESLEAGASGETARILRLVRNATGVDFTHYKRSTLDRRIRRHMSLRGFSSLTAYRQELERDRSEARALCESCLVTVTQFFRDPAVYEFLKKTVFPALAAGREPQDPIRIWAAGCSTGEEAYSIAICLTEYLEEAGLSLPFELFATDVSDAAVEKARAAFYPRAALADVEPRRLERFFSNAGNGRKIVKSLRETCVFARHNLTQDPPFSKLDLISCRNVLIYMDSDLQRRVLSSFHYALKPGGYLALGPAESADALPGAFQQLGKAQKVFGALPQAQPYAALAGELHRAAPGRGLPEPSPAAGLEVQRQADRLVLAEHGPPGVIIDSALNIVQVRGHTAAYLELSPGEPVRNLIKLAREGLIAGLGKAVRVAAQTNAAARDEGFRIGSGGELIEVAIQVVPLAGSTLGAEPHFLVLFEESAPGVHRPVAPAASTEADRDNVRLRRELAATKEFLAQVVDDKAITLEQLRAANEEAQAGNEELETAQEELESANEELNTLNESLKLSNAELSETNRDLANLLESISIPLVMVDRGLRIRRFTRAMEPVLNLVASDVGRSITEIRPHLKLPGLRRMLLEAMDGGGRKPRDVRDAQGRWHSLRILPSAGPAGNVDGAVLMLIDIDAAKRGLDFAEAIVETVREPLVTLDQNLRVLKANRTFYETFRAAPEDTEERLIYDLGNGQWNIPQLRELLESILPARSTFRDFEVTYDFEHVGRKVMLLNASEIFNPNARMRTILLAIEDVTERKQAEEALRRTNAELQQFAYALTHDLQEPLRMVVNFTELLGRDYAGKLGAEADRYIAYSVEGALRIEALLKALLAYWEVAGREQESPSLVDCGAVLAMALLNLQAAVAQSGAVVTSGPLPAVAGEEVLLLQLFQNLISNAIKYRSAEPPRIHVSAEKSAGAWVFSVRDNGMGIAPEDSARVFGMFKRLHGSEIPGTGIGLALCQKVVERQGGKIWVESEAGRGATFKFTIPAGRKARSIRREG